MGMIVRSLGVACLICLAGCTGYVQQRYWTLTEDSWKGLKPGVTTKNEVLQSYGDPLTESYFPRQKDNVLEYRYLLVSATVMLAWLHFDQQGVLTYAEHRIDPAFYGGLGFM